MDRSGRRKAPKRTAGATMSGSQPSASGAAHGTARTSGTVGSVLSPAALPAFLKRDCKYGLGQLDWEQVAGRDRDAALVDPVQEGAADCVEWLRGYQRLDYEASVERDGIGQKKLRLLDSEDTAWRAGVRL
jgi:hypothetical protein